MRKIIKILSFITLIFSLNIPKLFGQTSLEIFEIQGANSTSFYENTEIYTQENVVTAVGNGYFYIQTPTNRTDDNPNTSNGILVYSDESVKMGDFVNIQGFVREINDETALEEKSLTKIGNNQPLPIPVILSPEFPKHDSNELESVEGMYIQINSGIINEPINDMGFGSINATGVRSFREPGNTYSLGSGIPVWDKNPENFELSLNNLKTNFDTDISAGSKFESKGVISHYEDTYYFLPTDFTITSAPTWEKVPSKTEHEFTIGSINCLLLFDGKTKLNLRIEKLAKYIVEVQNSPDILALQEVGTIKVLENLIKAIKSINPNIHYIPYLPGDNDIFNTAFLVSNRISDVSVRQLAKYEQVSFGGRLHYRPPLLLEGKILSDPVQDITVLNLHLKSFIGLSSSTSTPIRRQEQAISIGKIIRALQLQDKNIVVVGDFNAYPFTDGYTDPVNQIAGTTSLGAKYPVEDVGIDPPLTNQFDNAPLNQRYTYIYQGTSQVIDHCLTGDFKDFEVSRFSYAHGNADFSEDLLYSNSTFHSSDHDGFVLFLDMKSPIAESISTDSVDLPRFPTFVFKDDKIVFNGPLLNDSKFKLFTQHGQLIFNQPISKGSEEFSFSKFQYLPTAFYYFTIENTKDFISGKIHFFN